jgi:hypothetical protein
MLSERSLWEFLIIETIDVPSLLAKITSVWQELMMKRLQVLKEGAGKVCQGQNHHSLSWTQQKLLREDC